MRPLSLLLPALLLVRAPEALALGPVALPSPAAALPPPQAPAAAWLLAREGRGHGQRGGGDRARTGLGQRPSSFDRGSRRPSGGWSDRVGDGDRARRGLNRDTRDFGAVDRSRFAGGQHGGRNRSWDRFQGWEPDQVRNSFRDIDRNRIEDRARNLDRRDWDRARNRWDEQRDRNRDRWNNNWDRARDRWNTNNIWHNRWPGWVRPGWGLARPWRWGWYGGSSLPSWGWWGARSALWGIGTLATASLINNAVNDAIEASRTTIVVPDSNWTLYYNSVEPSGDDQIRFSAVQDQNAVSMAADCRSGELNGSPPATAAEAQLLNAACQVAFGNGDSGNPGGGYEGSGSEGGGNGGSGDEGGSGYGGGGYEGGGSGGGGFGGSGYGGSGYGGGGYGGGGYEGGGFGGGGYGGSGYGGSGDSSGDGPAPSRAGPY